jgi:peroxiredoxin Q/BCP
MLKKTSDTLEPGDVAPEFSLPTIDRKPVRLTDYRGKRVVLVFIRGTW